MTCLVITLPSSKYFSNSKKATTIFKFLKQIQSSFSLRFVKLKKSNLIPLVALLYFVLIGFFQAGENSCKLNNKDYYKICNFDCGLKIMIKDYLGQIYLRQRITYIENKLRITHFHGITTLKSSTRKIKQGYRRIKYRERALQSTCHQIMFNVTGRKQTSGRHQHSQFYD